MIISELDRLKGALVDRYSLERELGSGCMATVYLAEGLKHLRRMNLTFESGRLAPVPLAPVQTSLLQL